MLLLLSSVLSIYATDCLQWLGLIQGLDIFHVWLEQIMSKQGFGGAFLEGFSFLFIDFYCFLGYYVDIILTKNFTFITVIHYSIKGWRT